MIDDKAVMQQAYRLGFLRCAGWAQRDDLFADVDSPTYKKDCQHDLSAIAQPVAPATANFEMAEHHIELLATMLHCVPTGESELFKELNAFCYDVRTAFNKANIAQPEQPTAQHNFCPRCGKRLGGIDDVHTCTAPAHLNLRKKTIEKLHKFLDASAGDGVISDGVCAAELYIEIFPEQYAESAK